jgi:hypothetical protein
MEKKKKLLRKGYDGGGKKIQVERPKKSGMRFHLVFGGY